MSVKLKKMQGCGNDFLMLDNMGGTERGLSAREAVFVCDRNFGIGADGYFMLQRSQTADASWQFFNSDGSEAEMCGNAARCAVRYLSERYFPGREGITLETKAGLIRGRVLSETEVEVSLSLQEVERFEYTEKVLEFADKDAELVQTYLINTGVPHAVIEVKDLATYPIARVGRLVQAHPVFQPEGTNVTFFQRQVGGEILATTFERGVEGETMACGTGAAAAAIICSELFMQPLPISVLVPGGQLIVDLSPIARVLLLRGPAEYVFDVEMPAVPRGFEKKTVYGERKKKAASK